jgi:hypothetical protein
MLTIKNINKLNNKTLGKKNFYVESIQEVFTIDNVTYNAYAYQYKITITNRKYAITITLDREGRGFVANDSLQAYKLKSSNGNILYLIKNEIRNMDIFIDKLRLVALSK